MMTMEEVCKEFRVTQKDLRRYDRSGLVKPAEKKGNSMKSWMYDDKAMMVLAFAPYFEEAGYSHKEIEAVYERGGKSFLGELNKCERLLEERKKSISEKITFLKILKLMFHEDGPSLVYKYLNDRGMELFTGGDSFGKEELKAGLTIYRLGELYATATPEMPRVQTSVGELFSEITEALSGQEEITPRAFLEKMLSDKGVIQDVTGRYGEGAVGFIREAVKLFKEDNR